MKSLTSFSDSGCTIESTIFNYNDTVYFNCWITSLLATTDSIILLEIYEQATDTLVETLMDNVLYSFTANTPVTIYTINSNVYPSAVMDSAYSGQDYYARLYITGSGVDPLYDKSHFSVVDAPIISAVTISDSTTTFDQGVIITATVSDEANRVYVTFFDSDGNPVYAKELLISTGTTWICTTDASKIPVDTYGTGDIWVTAVNDDDVVIDITSGVNDKTLTLTVTTAEGLKTGAQRWINGTIYVKTASGSYDDNGHMIYTGDWGTVSARIVRHTQEITDQNGNNVLSTAVFYISGANNIGINDRIKFSNDYSDTAEMSIMRIDTICDQAGNYEFKEVYV